MAGQAGRLTRIALVVAALGCCAATGASSPVQTLAGRYSHSFPDQLVNGETYTGKNIVEIVPVTIRAAYFSIHLDYANGRSCGISGIAQVEGQKLIFHDPNPPLRDGERACTLTIARSGRSLHLDDGRDSSCYAGYCGMRGTLTNVDLPWSSKRPVRNATTIEASYEYRDALTEWRTGKPVHP